MYHQSFYFWIAKPKGEAPKITQPLASKNVKDGEKVELVAKITGTEPLDVQWTFDKKPIKSDRIHMITYFKGTASLKLSRAVPRNSGEYSVLVRNQYGSADSMASVKVQGNFDFLITFPAWPWISR